MTKGLFIPEEKLPEDCESCQFGKEKLIKMKISNDGVTFTYNIHCTKNSDLVIVKTSGSKIKRRHHNCPLQEIDYEDLLSYLRALQQIKDIAAEAKGYMEFYDRVTEVLEDVH